MARVEHTGGGVMAVVLDLDNTDDPVHILVTYASDLDGDGVEGYDVGFYQNAADEGQIERVQDITQIAPLIDHIAAELCAARDGQS
jgi:hypothetical protein